MLYMVLSTVFTCHSEEVNAVLDPPVCILAQNRPRSSRNNGSASATETLLLMPLHEYACQQLVVDLFQLDRKSYVAYDITESSTNRLSTMDCFLPPTYNFGPNSLTLAFTYHITIHINIKQP